MRKKVLLLLMLITMCLTACGSTDLEYNNDDIDIEDDVISADDVDTFDESNAETDTQPAEDNDISNSTTDYDSLGDYWVEINGDMFTLPTSIDDIRAMGWDLSPTSSFHEPASNQSVIMRITKDDIYPQITATNYLSYDYATLEECIIDSIGVSKGTGSFSNDNLVQRNSFGIEFGMTPDDVDKLLESSNLDKYTDYSELVGSTTSTLYNLYDEYDDNGQVVGRLRIEFKDKVLVNKCVGLASLQYH